MRVRGPVEEERHNAINDSGPDGKTSKRSDGSAGYLSKIPGAREPMGECVCVQDSDLLSDKKNR